MISAILVDDEMPAITGLSSMIRLFCPEIHIAGYGTEIDEAIGLITRKRPDLVFLDMEMADNTGFDIYRANSEVHFTTIVVTAHENYALQAIKQNVVDYLLKPVDPDDLVRAVAKARNTINNYYIINGSNDKEAVSRRIGVSTSNGIQYIQLTDIIRLESKNNYTFIYTTNAKPLLISRTLKSFESILPSSFFIRCHQRHIVNLEYITSFIRSEKNALIKVANDNIPVSRSHKYLVYKELKRINKVL